MDSIWSNGVEPVSSFLVAIYFAIGFLAARFFLDKFIFRLSLLSSIRIELDTAFVIRLGDKFFFPEQLGVKGIQPLSYKALGLTVEILAAIHLKEWLFTLVISASVVALEIFREFSLQHECSVAEIFHYMPCNKLSIWLLRYNGAVPLKIDDAARSKIVKCSESIWKLAYYATVEACVLKITHSEPWFRDTKEYFRGWPNQELTLPLKLYYMCQCGFYTYSIAALLTWETRRKDFSVMMSHHVITVALIGYSYITRTLRPWLDSFTNTLAEAVSPSFFIAIVCHSVLYCDRPAKFFRIGSIILALHDASDVFMEAAKVFKYSEKELGASVFFGFFAISWLILRLIFFPFWVINATSYDLIKFLDLSKAYHTLLYYAFNTMLLMLLVFHIYWWVLICAMVWRLLKNRGKVGEDIRSDSEDDE
uniref:TLC domain-containing protein n=1 Tax=Quercus lobata TaxID=97700 RepID=A0A7N2MYM0_QUELO